MGESQPNLFSSLFEFRARACYSPSENFLTEAFAYFLRKEPKILDAWLNKLLNRRDIVSATCEVVSRVSKQHPESGTTIYPDLLIRGQDGVGGQIAVYCEHKWGAECDGRQLSLYDAIAKTENAQLAFIGSNRKQAKIAGDCGAVAKERCFLWEDVYSTLDSLSDKPALLMEFLNFMDTQGLSPGKPLSVEVMTAYLISSDFLSTLKGFASKLWHDYSWEAIPARFRQVEPTIGDEWGRVGIVCTTPGWKPTIVLGFLHDVRDHRVQFVRPSDGIDLMLRIESSPSHSRNIEAVRSVVNGKRSEFQASSVLMKGERGTGNNHTVLIIRECLAEVIKDASTRSQQLDAIYERLSGWLKILFDDGTLEEAFKSCGLDAGMN